LLFGFRRLQSTTGGFFLLFFTENYVTLTDLAASLADAWIRSGQGRSGWQVFRFMLQ
jgi:hypothetical protein